MLHAFRHGIILLVCNACDNNWPLRRFRLRKDISVELKTEFRDDKTPIAFYDGSQVIASAVPGGLNTFLAAEDLEQKLWRRSAIEFIKDKNRLSGGTVVVAGHFLLWDPQTKTGTPCTTRMS